MQAFSAWTPPGGTLGLILSQTLERIERLRADRVRLLRAASEAPDPPPLAAALRREHVAVIAEVKRRSPSKGALDLEIDAAARAAAYEEGGAAALSVLTEPLHFAGAPADLTSVRAAVRVPILRKDFHIDPLQVLEARALGASAVLLIARALSPAELRSMMVAADDSGLEAVVEVREERELEHAVRFGGSLIGVNQRDLESLHMDGGITEQLLPRIPAGAIAIAESGLASVADVERAARAGADAVLVGSALSAARDPVRAVQELAAVRRVGRAR